jgi:CRISPR-associated protein Csx10
MSKRNKNKNKSQKTNSHAQKTNASQGRANLPSKETLIPKPSFLATLTMLSDWHIGSGTGRPGDIDRLVQRERDNLPYIPAKTLTGIWRDACEAVALGLDNNQKDGNWGKWLNFLFGDQPADPEREPAAAETFPCPAAMSVRAARLPQSLRRALESKRLLQDALTFVKPGISRPLAEIRKVV